MARYRLAFKKSVAKDLRSLPQRDIQPILKRIDQLAENPQGAGTQKLSGMERYRARQGRYRILYEIQNEQLVVVVVKIAHGSTVYRKN